MAESHVRRILALLASSVAVCLLGGLITLASAAPREVTQGEFSRREPARAASQQRKPTARPRSGRLPKTLRRAPLPVIPAPTPPAPGAPTVPPPPPPTETPTPVPAPGWLATLPLEGKGRVDLAGPTKKMPDGIDMAPAYSAGATIVIVGGDYEPDQEVPIGVYSSYYDLAFYLKDEAVAQSDANGNFQLEYTIPADLAPGYYMIYPALPELADAESAMENYAGPRARIQVLSQILQPEPPPVEPSPTVTETVSPTVEPPPTTTPEPPGKEALSAVAESWPGIGKQLQVTFEGLNTGQPAAGGAALVISSPDVERLEIVSAGKPAVTTGAAQCVMVAPRARMSEPKSGAVATMPLALAWYRPWPSDQAHQLTLRALPKPGLTQLRFHVRVVPVTGGSGCRVITASEAAELEKQGYPTRVITVDVPQG
jgi:hypothetical protein